MSYSRLLRVTLVVGVASFGTIFACGGNGNGGGGGGMPDAAGMHPDAPGSGGSDAGGSASGLTGLGHACGSAADCAGQGSANGCLTYGAGAAKGICTELCLGSGSFMTNGSGQPGAETPNPTMNNATCAAIYSGSAGTASCSAIVNLMPAPVNNQLAPNTTYTFAAACEIACGTGNTCPAGLTCNTQTMVCTP